MQPQWTSLAVGLSSLALLLGTGALAWQGQISQAANRSADASPHETVTMQQSEQPALADASQIDSQLVQAQTEFGLALFEALRQESPQNNVLISPASVAIALTMAYNGAAGETQAAMAEVLRLQGMDMQQINQANQALQQYLVNADPAVELAIANSLWYNQDLPVHVDFIERIQELYSAKVAALDFTNPAAKITINDWVKEQTRDRIPTIVDNIPPDQLMFLINAVYFKGDWTQAFDPELTEDRPFTLLDGRDIQHPGMVQQGDYLYLETDQFQAVSLPYGEEALSFEVILPAEGVDLEAFYPQLTAENWQTWMSQLRSRPGTLQLPRFQFAYEADLIPALKALGLEVAFTDSADFSGLTPLSAAINQVRHKTFIDVTEEGTEAAAVTSIGIMPTSIPAEPEPPFQMEVNRPFLVAIRDRQTGALLFLGSVVDPR
ncbi:MAG: serpin family protein [Leptolyngbyaceae cyanobacterium SM2_5_2]|nr:serpin family protein [Leptolyngbyaceae cyanobacterium SM2_5_2]